MAPADRDDEGACVANLFRSGSYLAVTLDRAGVGLPVRDELWTFQQTFVLGVQHVLPFRMNPEPILRGIRACGFYMWNDGRVNHTTGTTQ